MVSRCCSLLISAVDRGATAPRRLSQSIKTGGRAMDGLTARSASPITSPSRRSMADPLGVTAIAPAAMISETNRNAIKGRNRVTSHLDLHHLANPEVPDDLHDNRAFQHQVAEVLLKERRHVVRVDRRQRNGQKRRQTEKHIPGESTVRRVDADLAQDLESFPDHVRQVVENLR